jgi:anti-sigma regulatory factor (Ser/Thr protein kinase)
MAVGMESPTVASGSFAFSLRPEPESGSLLRRRLRLWLRESGATESETFAVLLAVSEAVTNAIQHPQKRRRPWVDVEARLVDDLVTVRVRDYGGWERRPVRDEGGRGLPLMRAMMDIVEVERAAEGTSVTLQRQLMLN